MQNNKQANKNLCSKSRPMEKFYAILFWIIFSLTLILTGAYVLKTNTSALKDFSLPLLGLILTIGQLWQTEKKNRFEEEKYIQSRKDLYFDKKMEIILGINNYLEQLSNELVKPFFKQELSFDHQKFILVMASFYRDIVDKAKFLFDEHFINNINEITEIMCRLQEEIQIMQNHLMLSEKHRDCDNFINASKNYAKYWKILWEKADNLCKTGVEQVKINSLEENNA